MLLIPCPWCGPRDVVEFVYAGAAAHTRPEHPDALTLDAWSAFIYLRDNPRGMHEELWQHAAGCRRYVRVRRDTFTHEITASGPPGDAPHDE